MARRSTRPPLEPVRSVAAVVLNWRGTEDTLRCLESLAAQTYPDLHVLLVDNGSMDGDLPVLRAAAERSDAVTLIETGDNLGFGGGVNVGITRAMDEGYDAVALVNNDAQLDPGWVAEAVEAASSVPADIVTGLLLGLDGAIDSAGDGFSRWGWAYPRLRGGSAADLGPDAGGHEVFGSTAGASLYRTSVFREIGLFDASYFMYYEDVDLALRARGAGLTTWFTPRARATHVSGATSAKVPGLVTFRSFRNVPLVLYKNVPTRLLLRIVPAFCLLYLSALAKAVATGSGAAALRGAAAAVRQIGSPAFTRAPLPPGGVERLWQGMTVGPPPGTSWHAVTRLVPGRGRSAP